MQKKHVIYLFIIGIITSLITTYLGYAYFTTNEKTVIKKINNIESLMIEAKNAYYNGNLKTSKKIYKTIANNSPQKESALLNLVVINKELGKINEAIENYKKLININDEEIRWHYELGVTLYQADKIDMAKSILEKIYNKVKNRKNNNHSLDVSLAQICYFLGKSVQKSGELDKALKLFKEGIRIDDSLTLNYLGAAETYTAQNNIIQSSKYYRKALKIDSSLSNLYPILAENFTALNKPDLAYYYWSKSLSTGNKTDLAKKRIKTLENKYPYLKIQKNEEKQSKRSEINWSQVNPLNNSENIPRLRIGLLDRVKKITFQTGVPFKIINKNNGKILLTGNARTEWQIKYQDKKYLVYRKEKFIQEINLDSSLLIKLTNNNSTFVIYDISYGSGYFWAGNEDRQYRGMIKLHPEGTGYINVINLVNIEEYLFSVVPAEMPAWWPEEALKAQSIAARSYALNNKGRHNKDGYDLCDTVHCAVYKGINSENIRTNQAILATRGQVATFKDNIINAVFSSNSGGYSESSEEVWGTEVSYLSGANNMTDKHLVFPLEPFMLEKWLKQSPPSYSNNIYTGGNSYRWIKILPVNYFINKYNLTKLINVIPLNRSKGGSIENLLIKGENKEVIIERDKIRSALNGLRSNRFIIKKIYDQNGNIDKLIIYGGGWGHNVGLDQTAAAGMADDFNYQEIVKHFYPGTKIKKLY